MASFSVTTRSQNICRAGALAALSVFLAVQAQAADVPIPNFAPDKVTSWFFDRDDGDNFLPPENGPGPVVSAPDHPYRPNGDGDDAAGDPTYRISDLSNPILTPWAIEKMRATNDAVRAGEIPFEAAERCYPPGVPAWNIFRRVGTPMIFFVQTPEKVLMIWRGDNLFRHVYLNVPHSENPKPSWHGESVGHYEGDTLVVDTIALLDHPLSFVDNYRTPHTDELHVVERFRLADGDTIDVNIYVEDPGAFTTPWYARQIMSRSTRGPMFESVCAEGNPDYFNLYPVPIPQTETPDF
jgi:hypothetical protein